MFGMLSSLATTFIEGLLGGGKRLVDSPKSLQVRVLWLKLEEMLFWPWCILYGRRGIPSRVLWW